MKLIIKDISSTLDDRVHSFECIVITEEKYGEYKKYSCGSDYIATNKWILRLVRKKQKDNVICYIQPISTYLKICCCQQNINDNSRQYNVEIYNGKEMISAIFDGTILTAIGCRDLLKFGCIYNESAVNHLLQYLTNSAQSAPIKNVHTSLGWRWEQGSPIFLSGKCISKIGFQSEYVGQLVITPKGSLDVWLDMIRAEVIGNIPLTFVMLTGFASILLGYINHSFDLGCFVFSLTNTSSKGKTTAAMLAASVFGSPAFDMGLVATMNSTQNAIIAFISQADSHTLVLDEAATTERGNLRKLLYQISAGSDRRRLNTDGQMKDIHRSNSIVLCSSEFPIFDCNAPNGIRARVFEIQDTLTKNAANADAIKACVYANYAHAGIEFAEYVVTQKLDSIIDDYQKSVKILKKLHEKQELPKTDLTDRILSKLAVILLTADYVKDCLGLPIDLNDIIKYIFSLVQSESNEPNLSEKAFDTVMQYITRHGNRFQETDGIFSCSSLEGTIKRKGKYKEITVLKAVVDEVLTVSGFENPRSIYKMWQSESFIVTEKDRPYKRVRIHSSLPAQPCFIFRISE